MVRRPYLYTHNSFSHRSLSLNSIPFAFRDVTSNEHYRDHNMAIRYRFFNRLDPGGSHLVFFLKLLLYIKQLYFIKYLFNLKYDYFLYFLINKFFYF